MADRQCSTKATGRQTVCGCLQSTLPPMHTNAQKYVKPATVWRARSPRGVAKRGKKIKLRKKNEKRKTVS